MKRILGIMLLVLIFSLVWRDVVVYGVFKMQQDYISQNKCINRNKPITQCHGNCVLTERLAQPLQNSPSSEPKPILIELKMEFLIEESAKPIVLCDHENSQSYYLVGQESQGHLPLQIKPPESV